MRILHLLSQRPELTGSGVYLNQMIQQAQARGHENAMLAGVPDDFHHQPDTIDCRTFFLRFGKDIPHHVTGMSDVMPYPSTRFRDLNDEQLAHYEQSFAELLHLAIQDFQPDIIHSNHLWIMSALARRLFPEIPIIASCHGSDLRQFRTNPHLQERILKDCRKLDGVLALSLAQRDEIIELYGIATQKVHVTGVGFNSRTFTWSPKSSAGPMRLVYAGKLSNAKGVPWLLRALDKLTDIDLVLDLCGSAAGPEKDDIVAQAQHMGERVKLHGNVEPQRLLFSKGCPWSCLRRWPAAACRWPHDCPVLKKSFLIWKGTASVWSTCRNCRESTAPCRKQRKGLLSDWPQQYGNRLMPAGTTRAPVPARKQKNSSPATAGALFSMGWKRSTGDYTWGRNSF